MKLTKAKLKQIIREELEVLEEAEGLGGTYDFLIYSAAHEMGDRSRPVAYVTGVPLDKIDTTSYVSHKGKDYKKPERFFELTPKFMEDLGFRGLKARWLEEGPPESIQVTANYSPATGKLTALNPELLPPIIPYKSRQ